MSETRSQRDLLEVTARFFELKVRALCDPELNAGHGPPAMTGKSSATFSKDQLNLTDWVGFVAASRYPANTSSPSKTRPASASSMPFWITALNCCWIFIR